MYTVDTLLCTTTEENGGSRSVGAVSMSCGKTSSSLGAGSDHRPGDSRPAKLWVQQRDFTDPSCLQPQPYHREKAGLPPPPSPQTLFQAPAAFLAGC